MGLWNLVLPVLALPPPVLSFLYWVVVVVVRVVVVLFVPTLTRVLVRVVVVTFGVVVTRAAVAGFLLLLVAADAIVGTATISAAALIAAHKADLLDILALSMWVRPPRRDPVG